MQNKKSPKFSHPKSPKHLRNGPEMVHHLFADFQEAARFQGWSLKTHGFFGSENPACCGVLFLCLGVRQTTRERKKKVGRYIDIFILQINFCLVEHSTANTALKQIFHQLPLTVSTPFSNLWGAPGWERSEHNPLPTVASLPNFELLIRSNMGTFPSKREMKNSFIKEALFISYRQYIIPNTGFI